jgi:hypothetical protein
MSSVFPAPAFTFESQFLTVFPTPLEADAERRQHVWKHLPGANVTKLFVFITNAALN